MKGRLAVVAGIGALLVAMIGTHAPPANAAALIRISNVAAGVSAPAASISAFTATARLANTGTFAQPAGSTLVVSVAGGAPSDVPAACAPTATGFTCTAGALAAGASQSYPFTVTPLPGAVAVRTSALATAPQLELNLLPDTADNSATATTDVVYDVAVTIGSNPPTVRNGDDTLVTATLTNTGAAQAATLRVATGGAYDTDFPLPAGCALEDAGATVVCSGQYATDQTRAYDLAVRTPVDGASITSTVTGTGGVDGSDTESVVTEMFADATAFVPEGNNLVAETQNIVSDFLVSEESAPGLFLDLNEINIEGADCGEWECLAEAAEALFPSDGTYSGSDPAHPYLWDITYDRDLECHDTAGPLSGPQVKCLTKQIYYIPSGGTTPLAMPTCATFRTSSATTLRNVDEVCLSVLTPLADGKATFQVALLRDIVIPIISGITRRK